MSNEGKFQLGRYWLDREGGYGYWYRHWYDAGTRRTRRTSTDTKDFETAKILLAAIVLEEGGQGEDRSQGEEPSAVRLVTVLNHYWKHHSDKKPRAGQARYAGETVRQYLEQALGRPARISDLTKARQRAFMIHAHETLHHAVATISRNLAIVNAALNFAAEGQIIIDVNGDEQEVKLLKYAPKLAVSETYISETTGAPLPKPRSSTIAIEDLAAFVEDIERDHLFRNIILALNTWGRPSALVELAPGMVDGEHQLLDMNPPGRRQTKKRRPTIGVSKNLAGWIEHWAAIDIDANGEAITGPWVRWRGKTVKTVRLGFYKHATSRDANGKPLYGTEITPYALRHLMATVGRNSRKPRVPKEQRQLMMGHMDPDSRVSDGYGVYEPDFLREAVQATDNFMEKLNQAIRERARAEGRHPKRLIFAPKSRPSEKSTDVEENAKPLKLIANNGDKRRAKT